MIVPFLRQDLQLLPGSSSEHGSPTWLLYDVLRNKYFSIGRTAFQLISNWSGGIDIDQFIKKIQNKGLSIEKQDTEDFINFLKINSLIIHSTRHDVELLVKEKESQEKNWLIRLIHNYLFFRIPLVKPDRWLKHTLPLARLFSSKPTRYVIYILGAIGLYIVIQQWEYFLKTFLYFFTWDGFIFYALALFFIKALHELGHAYTAKHFGCNVPSMGLAMLVFFPFLYTDTTNAWKLRNQKDRLKIDLSGVLVELHLALLSTFIWAILPDGTMKSIAFFIATTGWIASLTINISPFMKFDGYYVLSDWLKADNLQPRSFALAKWKLRKFLFDFQDAPPELLENSRTNIFIIYAWFTWLYRFTLFIGLAFLIYNYAFKVLGIFLFAVEIIWFIGLPIFKEILTWYKMKSKITFSFKTFRTISILAIFFFIFFYPWQSNIKLPAIYSSENFTTLYPSEDSKIIDVKIQLGQKLKKNEIIMELESEKLNFQINQYQNQIQLINYKLDSAIGSEEYLKSSLTLKSELIKLENGLMDLLKKKQSLIVKAPFNSEVIHMPDLYMGQWVNKLSPLVNLVDKSSHIIHAFISEKQLDLFDDKEEAYFISSISNESRIPLRVISISNTPQEDFSSFAILTSNHDGPIAVRTMISNNSLRSENAFYKITLIPIQSHYHLDIKTPGIVKLNTEKFSTIERLYSYITAIIIRESDF